MMVAWEPEEPGMPISTEGKVSALGTAAEMPISSATPA